MSNQQGGSLSGCLKKVAVSAFEQCFAEPPWNFACLWFMMRRRRPVQTLQFHFLIFTVVKSMLTLFRHRHKLLRRLTFTVYWASRHNSWAVIYLRENVLGEGCLVRTS